MRIAYLCADPGVPVCGRKGASLHVQGLAVALSRRGAEVHLLAASPGGPAPTDSLRLHALPPVEGSGPERELAALAGNEGVRAALEREGPFELVYERQSLWSFAGMEYARDAGTPGILELNAPLVEEQARYRSLHHRAAAERAVARALRAASAVLAVSAELAAHLTPGVPVEVVPNAVDPGRFPPVDRPALPARPFTVGFVGSLKPWHGLETLAEAFALLRSRAPEAHLLVVGDGPGRGDLERRLDRLGAASAARLVGSVEPAAVPALLASMDAAVAPYPDLRPFYFSPLKVFEYMASGLPVVASACGQLTEIVDHGSTGLLCAPGDEAALATALMRLRDDPRLRARLGRAAREQVLCDHTWDRVAGRVLRLAGLRAMKEAIA